MRSVRLAMLLSAFCLFTTAVSGDDKAPAGKMHGQLPQGWAKIGLTEEQKQKIYKIHNDTQAKIDDLNKQINELKDKKRKDEEAVLTDDQKKKLRDIMSGKAPADDKK